jgi:hypothetical protein
MRSVAPWKGRRRRLLVPPKSASAAGRPSYCPVRSTGTGWEEWKVIEPPHLRQTKLLHDKKSWRDCLVATASLSPKALCVVGQSFN